MKLYVKAPLVIDIGDNEELGRWVLENLPEEWSGDPVEGIDYGHATPLSWPAAEAADLSGMYPSAKRRLYQRIACMIELGRDVYDTSELMNFNLYTRLLEEGMSPYKLQELNDTHDTTLHMLESVYGIEAIVKLYKDGCDLAEIEDLSNYGWLVEAIAYRDYYSLDHLFPVFCGMSAVHEMLWEEIPLDDILV